jgi:pimeloyl-ACP methyl ester carboxylesterase
MFARYRRAPIFHRINDRGLRAYVSSLARPRADGQVELAYPPEWEAAIYRSGPLNLWERVGQLKTPTLIVYGGESDTFGAPARLRLEALAPHIRFEKVAAAGHLVPLERPEEVGRLILAFLHTLATGGRPFSFR